MPYWRCFYHLVWATHGRVPTIEASVEPVLFQAVKAKSDELKAKVLAVNATFDHVHVAVSIPPSLPVSEWIKQVKGFSSHEINKSAPPDQIRFQWQRSFGALTFGETNLNLVVGYIERQKEHHRNGTTMARLERSDDEE